MKKRDMKSGKVDAKNKMVMALRVGVFGSDYVNKVIRNSKIFNKVRFAFFATIVAFVGFLGILLGNFSFSQSAYAATLSLSVSDNITATALPKSASGTTATSDTTVTNISVSTDNTTGYTLSLKHGSSTSASALNGSGASSGSSISSISTEKATLNDFTSGTWGYKPTKKVSGTWTNLAVVHGETSYTSGYYLPGPTTTADIIDVTESANTTANQYNIAVATKIDTNAAVGSYNNSFIVEAVTNEAFAYTWEKYDVTTQYSWDKYDTEPIYSVIEGSSTSGSTSGYYMCTAPAYSRAGQTFYVSQTNKNTSPVGQYYIKVEGAAQVGGSCENTYNGGTVYRITAANRTSSGSILKKYTWNITAVAVTTTLSGYRQGTILRDTVTSSNSSAYPDNGTPDNTYWYVKRPSSHTKGSKMENTSSPEITAFPCDGIAQDGYWYVLKDGVCFNQNSGNMLPVPLSQDSYLGSNMTMIYYPSTQTYNIFNSSNSDPHVSLGGAYLETGKTYSVHMTTRNINTGAIDSSGSIQIFYAVGGAYSESQSVRVSGDQTATFTVPANGEYDIRLDNDFGKNMSITNLWIDSDAVQYDPILAENGSAMPAISSTIPTRNSYTFSGWYDNPDYTSGTQYYSATNESVRNWDKDENTTLYAGWEKGIDYMQDMTSSYCSSMVTGTTLNLMDNRDNNTYNIVKLSTGQCFMQQSLRLGKNKTSYSLSSTNSNLPSKETFTLAAAQTSGSTSWSCSEDGESGQACTTSRTYATGNIDYGNYYYWYTAAANSGSGMTSGDASGSICPKGWRLPTGGDSGDWKILNDNYNGGSGSTDAGLLAFPLDLVRAGAYDSGEEEGGTYGRYWSSTVNSSSYAYYMRFYNSEVLPTYYSGKHLGISVRCISSS